jgi:uncharacterized RDD family membrane protein YckC
MTIINMETLTAVENKVEYAGFFRRFVAVFIDGIILSLPISLLMSLFMVGVAGSAGYAGNGESISDLFAAGIMGTMAVVYLLATVGSLLYFALMESSAKQATIGKMAMGIKVTDLDGNRLSFGKSLARNASKILSGFIFYLGYIIAAFTAKKQGLHDMIANALVVKK